jgi:hypothetical protein
MRKHAIMLAILGCIVAGTAAWAQSSAPGGMTAAQGFNVALLTSQLSLYLPEDATRAMYSDFGGRAGGTGQAQGDQAPAGQAQRGQQRMQNLFTRDPQLFLTRDQIARLLPILITLKENPLPTPSRAKQVQADVDSLLTVAQKAEYERFRKTVEDLIQRGREPATFGYRQQAGDGAGGQGGGQSQQAQRGGPGTGARMTPMERRQRQLDAFIKVLQSRQKELGG